MASRHSQPETQTQPPKDKTKAPSPAKQSKSQTNRLSSLDPAKFHWVPGSLAVSPASLGRPSPRVPQALWALPQAQPDS